jgi:hypothetical protein
MPNKLASAMLGGLMVLSVGIPAANAADPGYCGTYATAAMRQVKLAYEIPGCAHVQGPRWSQDYNVHYSWCLTQNYGEIGKERDIRTGYLKTCRR